MKNSSGGGSTVIKMETKEGFTSVTTIDDIGNKKTEIEILEKEITETQEKPVVLPIPPVVMNKETKNKQTI